VQLLRVHTGIQNYLSYISQYLHHARSSTVALV